MSESKTIGRPFQPGQSGNPSGRPKLPEDVKEARAMNQIEVARVLDRFLKLTKDEIRQRLSHPGTSALEHLVGAIIMKGINHGDQRRLDFLLDRIVGKVPATVDANLQASGSFEKPVDILTREKFEEMVNSVRGEKGSLTPEALYLAYSQYCQSILAKLGVQL